MRTSRESAEKVRVDVKIRTRTYLDANGDD